MVEEPRMTWAVYGKTADGNAVQLLNARGIFVPPSNMIYGTGCDNLDLIVGGQTFGHLSTVKFGSTVYLQAVTLNHKSKARLHAPCPGWGKTMPNFSK
jgi:hypothetical protein